MSFIASDPGLQVDDPGTAPQRREVPVDPKDKARGSFILLLRPVPVGKWRALLREQGIATRRLLSISALISKLQDQEPADLDAIEASTLRIAELEAALEKANHAYELSIAAFVAWGCAGHEEIYRADGTQYPYKVASQQWLGKEWEVLHQDTLDLYGRLHIAGLILGYVTRYQRRDLPETFEAFFPDPTKGSPSL